MATIYDSYQLSNSRMVKPFVGSTLGELNRVSDVLQERYDASSLGLEGMNEFMKQARALPQDSPLLEARLKDYQDKLQTLSSRPDLENVTQDVFRTSRQLSSEYRNFAENYQRAMEDDKRIEELVLKGPGQGGISRVTADEIKRRASESYKGLQFDPKTGRYSGIYNQTQVAPEVDTAAWIKKVAGDVAASKNSTLRERDGGLYFVTQGNEWKAVDFEKDIRPAIANAYAIDREIQSDFRQRAGLAAWNYRDLKLSDIPDNAETKSLRADIESLIGRGLSESRAIQAAVAGTSERGLYKALEESARKYAFRETSSSFTIGDKTLEGEAALTRSTEPAPLLSLSYTTPGSGQLQTPSEVEANITTGKETLDQEMRAYQKFLQGKTRNAAYQVFGRDENGQLQNMTDKANEHRARIEEASKSVKNLEAVKKAAARDADFNPDDISAFQAEADKIYRKAKEDYARDGIWIPGSSGTGGGSGHVNKNPSAKRIEEEARKRREEFINQKVKSHPGYARYTKELQKRLNPETESSTLVMIQDPATRKAWSDNITAMVSDLGLESGALSFTIGSGPDQGAQLSASQYKDLKGNIEVVGFDKDRNGQTVIKLRANEKVRGKKTDGENIVLNLPGTDADRYLQSAMAPDQYYMFNETGKVMAAVNNNARMGEVTIPGTNVKATVRGEDGKWVVILPGSNGTSAERASSFEGVVDIITKASQLYK